MLVQNAHTCLKSHCPKSSLGLFVFILKVLVLKSLKNEFALNWQIWSLSLSYQNIIHGEKNVNIYLTCKQFEKTMFRLLIVFKMVETTFSNFQEFFADFS